MKIAAIILAVALSLWIAYGYFSVRSVEQISYQVVEKKQGYEIRQFEDHILAEVEVSGNYRQASNQGFSKVADYIFGNNTQKNKVAMTTPVIDSSSKIAMTTPVVNSEGENNYTIAFVMPSEYSLETLPEPNNPDVKIREVKGEKVAVLRFSWWATAKRMEKKKEQLINALKRDGLNYTEIQSARYNPPGTPPFMLRNEIWATLEN